MLARYEKKCIACDSLINNGDNAEYEPLLKAKTLLDDIRVVEKSDEAEQSGEVPDYTQACQYYEIANKLAPSDTLRYKIDLCVGR